MSAPIMINVIKNESAGKLNFVQRRIVKRHLSGLTRDLSIMLSARLHLIDSLQLLVFQSKNKILKSILESLLNKIKGGSAFAETLRTYPYLFSDFYVNLVEVGELTGKLDEMLDRISIYLEKMSDLKKKLMQAMTYPLIIISVALASLSFILFYVIPAFSGIFREFNSQLPTITVYVLNTSNFLKNNIPVFLLTVLIVLFLINRFKTHPRFQIFWNRIIISIPFIGGLVRKNYISSFCRTLGTLLESGISLLHALDITAQSSQNYFVRRDILTMKYYASKGEKLTHALNQSNVFPLMVIQMIAVGEETAELPFMLSKIAAHLEKELDSSIETLSSVIEPVIIVVLGIIIGLILISIYLPLFNLSSVMPG